MEMTNSVLDGYLPEEKEVYTLKDKITALACLGIGIFFTEFVFYYSFRGSLGVSIWFVLIMLTYLLFRKNEIKLKNRFSIIQLSLITILTLNINFISSQMAYSINVMFVYILITYFIYNTSQGNVSLSDYCFVDILFTVFKAPFKSFGKAIKIMKSVPFEIRKLQNIRYVFLGLLLAIPSVMIVLPLLMNSDDNMKRIFENLFSGIYFNFDIYESIIRFLFSVAAGSLIFSLMYTNKKADTPDRDEQKYKIDRMEFFDPLVMCAMVIPVCVLYAIFFVSQLNYFISGFFNTLPEQFSYSDYARQGFFELCEIAVVNFLIIIFTNFLVRKPEDTIPKKLKVCIIVLSVFTEILIATAMSKMIMYISEYGFTHRRVYTTWFMMLLAGCFALIILKQLCEKLKLIKAMMILITVSVCIISFGRPDAHIAKWNIQLYESGITEELDIESLSNLSYEALPYIDDFAKSGDRLSDKAHELLVNKAYFFSYREKHWTHYSYPVIQAEKILSEYIEK